MWTVILLSFVCSFSERPAGRRSRSVATVFVFLLDLLDPQDRQVQAVKRFEDAVELGLVAEGPDQGSVRRAPLALGGGDGETGEAVAPLLAQRRP